MSILLYHHPNLIKSSKKTLAQLLAPLFLTTLTPKELPSRLTCPCRNSRGEASDRMEHHA